MSEESPFLVKDDPKPKFEIGDLVSFKDGDVVFMGIIGNINHQNEEPFIYLLRSLSVETGESTRCASWAYVKESALELRGKIYKDKPCIEFTKPISVGAFVENHINDNE